MISTYEWSYHFQIQNPICKDKTHELSHNYYSSKRAIPIGTTGIVRASLVESYQAGANY